MFGHGQALGKMNLFRLNVASFTFLSLWYIAIVEFCLH